MDTCMHAINSLGRLTDALLVDRLEVEADLALDLGEVGDLKA
jgi:hypothetical protein